jgi:hypothetical protein
MTVLPSATVIVGERVAAARAAGPPGATTAVAARATTARAAAAPLLMARTGKLPDVRTAHHLLVVNWPGDRRASDYRHPGARRTAAAAAVTAYARP